MSDGTPERSSKPAISWKLALFFSAAASYGPHFVEAVLTLGYERSSNVRTGMWELLPSSPLFLPTSELHRALNLNLPGNRDWWVIGHACVCSVFIVGAQAWVLRQNRWLGYLLLAGSIAWSAFSAKVLSAALAM